jgi:uncharacterized membrane protein
MNRYLTIGLAVIGGAAVLEAALVPGIVIGGAAVLLPKYLPELGRRSRRALRALSGLESSAARTSATSQTVSARLGLSRAVAKTITYRIIVTSLDFTSNVLVIGDVATAAGLSTFALVAGPLFYFAHETLWNYYHGPDENQVSLPGFAAGGDGFTLSRALAKTITFRTIATVMDFTMTYVVVGDAVTAAGLSAFGFVVGPFVYWGHERAWDYFTRPAEVRMAEPPLLAISG